MPPSLQRRMPRRRRGQVAIFLLLLLTALAFVLLWNVDLHRIVTTKTRSQTAGDAAALAACRWQGITLNLVGELNLLHALALSDPSPAARAAASDAITNLQARLLFTGPLTALVAAQVAAKNNGMYSDAGSNARLAAYIADFEARLANGLLANPPYPDAWTEYDAVLQAIALDGIAAETPPFLYGDNILGSHILLDLSLYDAIANRDWCWFYLRQPQLLPDYDDYTYWTSVYGPLPTRRVTEHNCGFLPLWLRPVTVPLQTLIGATNLLDEAADAQVDMTGFAANSNVMQAAETWYVYDRNWWGAWDLLDTSGPDPFPATGPVRPEYNYAGADAYFGVHATVDRLTPGLDGGVITNINWTAAAKPFGAVGPPDGRVAPTRYDLVLPAFDEVRLIPVDASYDSGGGADDFEWLLHKNNHLPLYVQTGQLDPACRFCQLLTTWEVPAFRQQGMDWLSTNSYRCVLAPGGPGGGSRGGGRRHGH